MLRTRANRDHCQLWLIISHNPQYNRLLSLLYITGTETALSGWSGPQRKHQGNRHVPHDPQFAGTVRVRGEETPNTGRVQKSAFSRLTNIVEAIQSKFHLKNTLLRLLL